MGSAVSRLLFDYTSDSNTGLKVVKILKTHRSNVVTTLRIQPGGSLLATGDDFGSLLFFDLTTQAVDPHYSRHLLIEQGGISEICWLADDLIAVGTTRGKIAIYSSRNRAKRFDHICNVEAHGDGVSQVAVDSMAFAATTRCLASAAEGKIGVKLWNIGEDGSISEKQTGEQSPEYTFPRFVAFARNGAEIVVGYMEQAIIKRFAVHPWRMLERTSLCQKDADNGDPTREPSRDACLGNAAMLPRAKQLAVFNLRNGLDIYNFPELHGKRQTVFDVDPLTTQGIAVLKSGSLLACPTRDGGINLIDCNSAVVGRLYYKNRAPFNALDGLSMPSQHIEILVGAYTEKRDTSVVVWKSEPLIPRSGSLHRTAAYDSFILRLLTGILIYLICTCIQPLLASFSTWNAKDISAAVQRVWQPAQPPLPVERKGSWL